MSFSEEAGYIPSSFQTLMDSVRVGVNEQFGTDYTSESFVGTNFYKYFYALIQKFQENDVKTSEIFLKLQEYISVTNERISRPVVTPTGLIDKLGEAGYIASVKPPLEAEAGELYICVDVDEMGEDYAEEKLEICNIIKDSTVAGVVTQGAQTEEIVLSNGQAFDFKFDLPDRTEILLRLTVTLSENNQALIESPDDVKQKLIDNIEARYRLGKNFEPQRYFSIIDAPWAQSVLLEYSVDEGVNWISSVFDADYDELFVVLLENITLIET